MSLESLRQLATSLELCRKEGIMVCKLSNLINAKLEVMYDARFWFYTTIIHAIVFDAKKNCYRISQLS